jgi:phosphopantetheine--protein transferase-like protein
MSILGLGFDATDIPRVREVFARYGERFLHRVFTDGEIAYCTRHRDPVPSLAARFAAKEATIPPGTPFSRSGNRRAHHDFGRPGVAAVVVRALRHPCTNGWRMSASE